MFTAIQPLLDAIAADGYSLSEMYLHVNIYEDCGHVYRERASLKRSRFPWYTNPPYEITTKPLPEIEGLYQMKFRCVAASEYKSLPGEFEKFARSFNRRQRIKGILS